MAQRKLVHARESSQHHADDRVDLLAQTILDPTRRILSKKVLGRVEKVDVEQNYDSGKDKSCLTAIFAESERLQKVHEDERTTTREPHRGGSSLPKSSWEAVGAFDAPSWKHTGTQECTVSWGFLGAQPRSKARVRYFIHPKQFGTFPKRFALPYSFEEILTGYEEDVSSIRDGFSAWVKADTETILRRHVVDARGLYTAFREAPVRRHDPSSQECQVNDDVPNRLTEQRGLSVFYWKPGLRRGKEGAIEGSSMSSLQEAMEYLDHGFLTNRFHVTHIEEAAQSCSIRTLSFLTLRLLQGVISRASFRRLPRSGKSFFTTMSLHINNQFAKKRGIGKKLLLTIRAVTLEEHVDLVAADFNGAAWRRPCGNDRKPTSVIEEAFADADLPMSPGPTPLWGPGAVPGEWTDVCGFLKPPDFHERWKVRMHGAFSTLHSTFGLLEKIKSCMHPALTDHCGDYAPREKHDRRLHLK